MITGLERFSVHLQQFTARRLSTWTYRTQLLQTPRLLKTHFVY